MPGTILRACAACGAPFTPRHARHRHCPGCEPHGNEHRSPTTRTRPSSSTEREFIRAQVLAGDPDCALALPGCTGKATVADHIVAAEDGGAYTLDNLQPACHHCNSVRGGRRPSPLKHGRADQRADRPVSGEVGPRVVGPTRLA